MEDDIPREVKARRNNELLAVQDAIAMEDNKKLIGDAVEVLVEGPSKKGQKEDADQAVVQMIGRTHRDRIVVFDGNRRQAGQFLKIHVDDASSHTLVGRVQTVDVVTIGAS